MSEFKINSITNQNGSAGPQICGVTTFSGKSGVQLPSGPTGSRAGVGDIGRDGLIFYVDGAKSQYNDKDIPLCDLSDFGSVGQMVNGASIVSNHGGVFNFDGTDDFITFQGLPPYTSFTFVTWCYADTVSDGESPFAHGESFISDKAKCVIRINNSGGMSWWYEAANDADYNIYSNSNAVDPGKNPPTTFNDFPTTTWVMVVAQWDDANMKQILHMGTTSYNNLYSNSLTRPEKPADIQGDGPVVLGCRTNSGNNYVSFWDGQVAMACIYDRVLDDAELTQIWNDTSGRLGY